jgi:hypothetical protein
VSAGDVLLTIFACAAICLALAVYVRAEGRAHDAEIKRRNGENE